MHDLFVVFIVTFFCLFHTFLWTVRHLSNTRAVVCVSLITAEESACVLLPSQEVLSECGKNDWTMAVAGT